MAKSQLDQHWFRWHAGDLLLSVVVQPGAKRGEIVGLHGGSLKLRIQAPPVDGKANRAIVTLFAELFALPRSQIAIRHGDTTRIKTVQVHKPVVLPAALRDLGLVNA